MPLNHACTQNILWSYLYLLWEKCPSGAGENSGNGVYIANNLSVLAGNYGPVAIDCLEDTNDVMLLALVSQ